MRYQKVDGFRFTLMIACGGKFLVLNSARRALTGGKHVQNWQVWK
ncbi:hypothetical protein BD01_1661 [Thermococcus nautili]|uniref:Uncharacterized protein n=1 Tax=Thermococcus nautili TaxID=195522 RepID=W8P6X6_9EURY|nr:hypothetical protein BD01_1661 [Thermococcus nautili]